MDDSSRIANSEYAYLLRNRQYRDVSIMNPDAGATIRERRETETIPIPIPTPRRIRLQSIHLSSYQK